MISNQKLEQGEGGLPAHGFRRNRISRRVYDWARGALPRLSATERQALGAGDVWWDRDLFAGSPDWQKLLAVPKAAVSERERRFLDGPCRELCGMLDDWQISFELRDLPPEVWDFMRRERFFGMIIPEEHGGLGFGAYAHSEVVRLISTRSLTAAITVMVPNSLGPGELLLQFGTEAQKRHWLPRLADGREIPCFGLTSPEAGSDAASMTDEGVVTWGEHDGERVLGLRLNWHKRYITLGPVATVLGLAVKTRDPEGLLGGPEDLGITVVLVPTDAPGVEIGRRHLPCMQAFQNGPNKGHDVFLPLDAVLGGRDCIGQGWTMLMSALAAGRGISLPSLSAAGVTLGARTTGAYARVREQFGIPIGRMEGVQVRLARLAALSYQLEAARWLTCSALDAGHHPVVISAIMKTHATYRLRTAIDDAMDVHAGKTIIDGPSNYLGNYYRAVPVGITVEGANLLSQNFIIFGQGAIRCHPHLLDEMMALEADDREAGLDAFDAAFWAHVRHSAGNVFRAWGRAWTGARIGPAPKGPVAHHFRRLSRYASALSLVADLALLTIGGALKRKEMISARLGDILSELYLLSAVLKRFEDEGRQEADLPLVAWCMETGASTIERRFDEVLRNFPSRGLAALARLVVLPAGVRAPGPDDETIKRCAAIVFEPGEARERLTAGVYCGETGSVKELEDAFALVVAVEPLRRRLRQAEAGGIDQALERGVISREEAERLRQAEAAVARVIAVDDFAPEELSPLARQKAPDEGGPGFRRENRASA